MNDNQVDGTGHEVKGAIKEGVGKVTGNQSQELEGNVEKNAGKVQRKVGDVADDLTDDD